LPYRGIFKQFLRKRTLEIAAAGGHNLLVYGPPGAGKTMLARRFPTITGRLETAEAVTVTRLHSLAGEISLLSGSQGLNTCAPFRAPHHSASAEGILGGGKNIRPGEISLAHFGSLFLDEAPEFKINVLQSLREPMEDKVITISRARGHIRLPADFQLIMASNPCPCGRLGTENQSPCLCSNEGIRRYWKRLGGALLDRIELRVPVCVPSIDEMSGAGGAAGAASSGEESSAVILKRVEAALAVQRARYAGTGIRRNASLPPGALEKYCVLNDGAASVFRKASLKLGLSGRAYHGILRVARTIADLEGKDAIQSEHILEAIVHRRQGDDPFDILQAA